MDTSEYLESHSSKITFFCAVVIVRKFYDEELPKMSQKNTSFEWKSDPGYFTPSEVLFDNRLIEILV